VPVQGANQGWIRQHRTFTYDDPALPATWTTQAVDDGADGSVDSRELRRFEQGRLARYERRRGETPAAVWTYRYDGGRLAIADRDQGFWQPHPDGTPDVRMTWTYDGAGALAAFEQDGTDALDDPRLDGVADYRERWAPACAPLVERFPWIAHLPRAGDTTPPFRD
jgi:hypothetical protein